MCVPLCRNVLKNKMHSQSCNFEICESDIANHKSKITFITHSETDNRGSIDQSLT